MRQKLTTLSLIIALLFGVSLFPLVARAAGASISLTASKSTVANGGSVIIAVYMNGGGTAINAVEADLTYAADKLQYVGISYSGSAFSINAPNNGGGSGAVTIADGTTSPISGSGLVATVTFRALVGSGSTSIGVAGSSSLVSASDNSAVGYYGSGVSLNFGVASTSPSAATATTLAPPKDTTPPVITAIKVQSLTPLSATITWVTNEVSDSVVDFGLDNTYGLSNSASTLVTAHSVTLSSTFLTPQTLFHYHVKSTDASGNVATSTDQTLNLPGMAVTVLVRGPGGKPQEGVTVSLDNSSATTDVKGTVVLPSGLGNKKITTTYQGVTIQKPITITKATKLLPPVQLDLSKKPLNHWMLTSFGLLIIVLVLLGIDAMLFGSHFFARLLGLRFMQPAAQPLEARRSTAKTIAEAQAAAERGETTIVSADATMDVPTPVAAPPALRAIDSLQPLSLRTQIPQSTAAKPISDFVSSTRPTGVADTPEESSASSTLVSRLKKPSVPKSQRTKRRAAKKLKHGRQ